MDQAERVTDALRTALTTYAQLDPPGAARVVVALFGLADVKRLAPLLDELARNVQPAQNTFATTG